jgi:hypothetical protein
VDIASFLFGVGLGLVMGGLVAWLAGRVTTARILAWLDAERQGSAEKLAEALRRASSSSRPPPISTVAGRRWTTWRRCP